MSLVLEEWGLTTDAAELKIGNRSKRDLDAENLNLHHEKDVAHVCVSTWKVLSMQDRVKLK